MNFYCQTDVGVKRKMNQDFVYASDQPVGPLPNLFIVADGMGGHKAGDYASRMAVETMVGYIESCTAGKPIRLLREAIEAANREVHAKAESDSAYAGMGTTMVAATVIDELLYIANVGDSRLYVIDDRIDQITRDHSLVQEMVRKRQITKDEARVHPEKNVITRAIGVHVGVEPDFFDVSLNPGDIVLLCSDGLSNMIPDGDLLKIVKSPGSLESVSHKLIDTANDNGGSDNISVVLVEPIDSGV